jgi:hypothetical protein
MAYNALRNTVNFARPQRRENNISSFDSQVHCEELLYHMSFDMFTPEERAEFESIHDELDMKELETVQEWRAPF